MSNSYLFILLILICGCSYTPLSKSDTENLNSLKSRSIIDLTSAVDFDRNDSLVIMDSLFLLEINNLIKGSSKDSKIVYLAKHEDRSYLNNLQYKAEQMQDYFIDKGSDKEKVGAEVGLDYQLKYPELKNSSIVLL
ncbi:MAG: hypothetical protein ACI9P5_004648, partial [Saprospiraceae bacterium]